VDRDWTLLVFVLLLVHGDPIHCRAAPSDHAASGTQALRVGSITIMTSVASSGSRARAPRAPKRAYGTGGQTTRSCRSGPRRPPDVQPGMRVNADTNLHLLLLPS
jgi:hypothetical protein